MSGSSLSSPTEPVRKTIHKKSKSSKTRTLAIVISSDDEGKAEGKAEGEGKSEGKAEGEGKSEGKATTITFEDKAEGEYKDKETSPPKCGNESHGVECQGVMPSCQGKVVQDFPAWREFVESKIQEGNAWEDTSRRHSA